MSVKTLVTQEICDEITELSKMELGTETSKTAINGVGVLMDKAIDLEKLELRDRKSNLRRQKSILREIRWNSIKKIEKSRTE